MTGAISSILMADHGLAEWLCLLKITKRFGELIEREHPVNHGMGPCYSNRTVHRLELRSGSSSDDANCRNCGVKHVAIEHS